MSKRLPWARDSGYHEQNDERYAWWCRTCPKCSAFISFEYDNFGQVIGKYCKRCRKSPAPKPLVPVQEDRL